MKDTTSNYFKSTSESYFDIVKYDKADTYYSVNDNDLTTYVERNEHYKSGKYAVNVSTSKSREHKKISNLNELLSKIY